MDATFVEIPGEDLHDSPTNPRKFYDEAKLQELAENIKAAGVLQPILVRPRVPPLFAGDPDAQCGFEIVCGHRRKRAAFDIAGLATVPCIVRSLTDHQVEAAQISENLQREDVNPIEEAQGLQALIDRHGETPDTLAAKLGKSRSHIYGQLKLLQLCAEIREACLVGEIGAQVAVLIGRLRSEKLQRLALADVRKHSLDLRDGGKASFRRIRDMLNERYTLKLGKGAPFPVDDADLIPAAGTCTACPKLSGNAPEFADVASATTDHHWIARRLGPDVCTDPDCFASKKAALYARQAAELVAKGRTVVAGVTARNAIDVVGKVKGAFVPLSQVRHALQAHAKAAAKTGAPVPVAVLLQDPRDGKTYEAVKRADLIKAGVLAADAPKKPGAPRDAYAEQTRQRAEQAEAVREEREALLARVRGSVANTARSIGELRLVAQYMLEPMQAGYDDDDEGTHLAELWGCKGIDALAGEVASMGSDDLGRLLLDFALIRAVRVQGYNFDAPATYLDAVARLHGLAPHDGLATQAIHEGASTPSAEAAETSENAAPEGRDDIDHSGQAAAPSEA